MTPHICQRCVQSAKAKARRATGRDISQTPGFRCRNCGESFCEHLCGFKDVQRGCICGRCQRAIAKAAWIPLK